MPRINPLEINDADHRSRAMLDVVRSALGMVPNMFKTMAHAPAVLDGYLKFSAALHGGRLSAPLREQIALAVAEANGCHYCLAAHSALGKKSGLTAQQIEHARRGSGDDGRARTVLAFVTDLVAQRGAASDEQVQSLVDAGLSDAGIAEVVAHVALNLFTNYFNLVAGTAVDFPAVKPLEADSTCAASHAACEQASA